MSDILSPNGFEPNEPLESTDIQEVYQPTSGGVRRNKQSTLATLKLFFQKLAVFTPNNIMESDGTGNPRTTSISTSSVSASIADTNTNTNNLAANINQGVKTTDDPIFAGATIDGHDVGAELSTLNNNVNQGVKTTDQPTFVNAFIGGHDIDSELDVLNGIVDQDLTTTATPTFFDVILTGLGNIKAMITTLNSRVDQGVNTTDIPTFDDITITGLTGSVEARIETNTTDIGTNDDDILINAGKISDNKGDIEDNAINIGTNDTDISNNATNIGINNDAIFDLETKTPQSYITTDDVTFNSVSGMRQKIVTFSYNGTTGTIVHGVTSTKIRSISVIGDVAGTGYYLSPAGTTIDATNIYFVGDVNSPFAVILKCYIEYEL